MDVAVAWKTLNWFQLTDAVWEMIADWDRLMLSRFVLNDTI